MRRHSKEWLIDLATRTVFSKKGKLPEEEINELWKLIEKCNMKMTLKELHELFRPIFK